MKHELKKDETITTNYYEFGQTINDRMRSMRSQMAVIENRAYLYHVAPLHEDLLADFDAFEKRCLAKAEHFIALEETVNGG